MSISNMVQKYLDYEDSLFMEDLTNVLNTAEKKTQTKDLDRLIKEIKLYMDRREYERYFGSKK